MTTLSLSLDELFREFESDGTLFGASSLDVVVERASGMNLVAAYYHVAADDFRAIAAIAHHQYVTVEELKLRTLNRFIRDLGAVIERLNARGQLARLSAPLFDEVREYNNRQEH